MQCRWNKLWTIVGMTVVFAGTAIAEGENWPSWRGPQNNGISPAKNPPVKFSQKENVLWRAELPGTAGSTPVVWNGRVFLTTADQRNISLIAFDAAGKQLWTQVLSGGNRAVRNDEGNYASPSPSTDGKYVWAMSGIGVLACFDYEGKAIWTVDLQERYGKFRIQFGMSTTPLLDGDTIYLQLLHTDAALVIALDKRTGKEKWKQVRKSDASDECLHSYASPIIYRDSERAFLVTHGADYVMGHSLENGEEIWRCGNLNPEEKYNPTLRFVASPAAVKGLIVAPTAKNGPIVGIDPAAKGDITAKKAELWRHRDNTPDVASPLIYDGLVYLIRENGVLLCLDAKTGETVYSQRVHAQRHRASPTEADGNIYLAAFDGTVNVVKAGRRFELVGANKMEESITSSPVLADGKLYLRTYSALYCIGKK